ncbi:MAG: NAD-dependent epimerase/dehydratase family protein [Cyclobacteriaceae bacterium]|nr:NAD-dependent epimerase/dehydratase family protein [Cyclobacteriaceae bacterium]
MEKYKDQTEYRLKLIESYLVSLKLPQSIGKYYKSKKILVTGGAGAIGSNLVCALSKLVGRNGLIIVLDNLSATVNKSSWNVPNLKNVIFVEGDMTNDEMLRRVFQEKPSIVFHLAAFFANQNSVDFPEKSAKVDIVGISKLLQLSNLTEVSRFVYASSGCAVYGSSPKLPVSEDFVSMHLTTPYQINKMAGEMYCNYFNHQFGLKTVNCRFFNSYGPGEIPGQYRNVIPNFIYWGIKKQSLPITGDGTETRDFTNVLDLTQGLIKAGFYEDAIGQNFNLAAGKEIAIKDIALLRQCT